jgi:hypothetical protein
MSFRIRGDVCLSDKDMYPEYKKNSSNSVRKYNSFLKGVKDLNRHFIQDNRR